LNTGIFVFFHSPDLGLIVYSDESTVCEIGSIYGAESGRNPAMDVTLWFAELVVMENEISRFVFWVRQKSREGKEIYINSHETVKFFKGG
jgi:hypothetical protein